MGANLNALNDEKKTPLAYLTQNNITKLCLQNGVVMVKDTNQKFDNNILLSKQKLEEIYQTSALFQNQLKAQIATE
jgi:hypothetical protein